MAEHNILGKEGEKIALNYLKNKGYVILETNWRIRYEEVDIICKSQNELVFVEVKTRTRFEHTDPNDLISNQKIKHLIDAAEEYVVSKQLDMESRFDVVVVVMDNPPKLSHIPNAFGPEM